jgi:hypothetical protein
MCAFPSCTRSACLAYLAPFARSFPDGMICAWTAMLLCHAERQLSSSPILCCHHVSWRPSCAGCLAIHVSGPISHDLSPSPQHTTTSSSPAPVVRPASPTDLGARDVLDDPCPAGHQGHQ